MWYYEGNAISCIEDIMKIKSDSIGFVYKIINIDNGKQYIGKKLLSKSKIFQKNKKKKRTRVASDWIEYTGSNEELNQDINNGAKIQKFIIHLCKSRGWCTYWETKEILTKDAIIDPMFYNSWVSCKIRKSHLK